MAASSINITDFKAQMPGKVSDDKLVYEFPLITSINNRTKKKTLWRILVGLQDAVGTAVEIRDSYFGSEQLPVGICAWIRVVSGIEGGKVRDVKPTIVCEGKNAGKANATNAFTQALRDALGLHNKQAKKSTSAKEEAKPNGGDHLTYEMYPPMLALNIETLKKKPDWDHETLFVQRKYNGVRVVSTYDGEFGSGTDVAPAKPRVILYSRSRHEYPDFDYIKSELLPIFEYYWRETGRKLYLDSELYKAGIDLQELSGIARRILKHESRKSEPQLELHVYDCFLPTDAELTFSERLEILEEIFAKFGNLTYIKFVPTYRVDSHAEMEVYYKKFLSEGYEGIIIRRDAPYQFSYNSYHSPDLLKKKPVHEEEFKIIGYTEGEKGKAKGALMLILETPEGKKFTITPGLTMEERYKLFAEMPQVFERDYKGKMLTVLFDEYSADKIPVRARTDGLIIRNYE